MIPTLCTLFDHSYLEKGIALIRSLQQHHAKFHLFVLALDAEAEREVRSLRDKRVMVISLERIETDALRAVKAQRTRGEYCWTLTPFWVKWLLADFRLTDGATTSAWHLENVAYMDADSYLFAPLDALYAEINGASVAIIPHRFPPRLAWRAKANGIYNVNFVYFKNDETGRRAADDWARQCLEWCEQKSERATDGSLLFGDQAYLDTWGVKYNAHVVKHLGANLAPWNQEQYAYTFENALYVIEYDSSLRAAITTGYRGATEQRIDRIDKLLFYHFHEHHFEIHNGRFDAQRGGYPLKPELIQYVYEPYERELAGIYAERKSLVRA